MIFKDMTASDFPTSLSGLTTITDGLMIETPVNANLVFKIRNNDGSDGIHIIDNQNEHVFTANANNRVGIGIATPSYTLHVNGSVAGTSAYNNTSDARLKTNVIPLTNSLEKITQLQGVTFDWDKERTVGKKLKLDEKNHIGFIAQEVEKVFPQVVSTDDSNSENIKSIAYADIVPVLVEAIKEQQQEIEKLNEMIKELQNK